jgi:adenylate cyclase
MGIEIERKFLLPALPRDRLEAPGERIEQGYLAIDAVAEVRVRRRGDLRTLTVKSAPALIRVEEEIPIDASRFAALWELSRDRRIAKTRYLIDLDGATVEIDEYHEDLAGLVTAEVEFGSAAASGAFVPPAWLGREVTGDPAFANQSLATRGIPETIGGGDDERP